MHVPNMTNAYCQSSGNTLQIWVNSLLVTIKLTLRNSLKKSTKLTLCNNYFQDGSTCAHIAAAKGSLGVVEELMKHDLNVVLNSRNKVTDSTSHCN